MKVSVQNVSYTIGGMSILQQVSFEAYPGELLTVLGANGAGKSTLFKLLSKEAKPTSGNILFNGLDLNACKSKSLANGRAILTQHQTLSIPFTTLEIVLMGRYAKFNTKPARNDLDIVDQVIEYTGIKEFQHRIYSTLSGGEQQRVQLARVLAQLWDSPEKSRLLLLDEPVSALDIQFQYLIMNLIKKLLKHNFTIITVLHDINLALQYADRFLLLKKGKVIAFGDHSIISTDNLMTTYNVQTTFHTTGTSVKQVSINI
jgi:iron complex transport system ATP-binding protein